MLASYSVPGSFLTNFKAICPLHHWSCSLLLSLFNCIQCGCVCMCVWVWVQGCLCVCICNHYHGNQLLFGRHFIPIQGSTKHLMLLKEEVVGFTKCTTFSTRLSHNQVHISLRLLDPAWTSPLLTTSGRVQLLVLYCISALCCICCSSCSRFYVRTCDHVCNIHESCVRVRVHVCVRARGRVCVCVHACVCVSV